MPEHDETIAADAGEAINDIRRFGWAAADVTEAREKVAARLDKVRAAFEGTRERLEAATEHAQPLARHGLTIDKSDMDAVRAERILLTETLQATFGQIDKIRDRFWIGALCIGIGDGIIGGGSWQSEVVVSAADVDTTDWTIIAISASGNTLTAYHAADGRLLARRLSTRFRRCLRPICWRRKAPLTSCRSQAWPCCRAPRPRARLQTCARGRRRGSSQRRHEQQRGLLAPLRCQDRTGPTEPCQKNFSAKAGPLPQRITAVGA